MKKLLSISILLVGTLILSNCTKVYEENLELNNGKPHSEFVIPIDSALLYLSDCIDGVSETKTRSSLKDKIANIQTVKFNSNTTKASNSRPQEGNADLMYLVNFNNDQGYAILSADTRIETPVLALTDRGTITSEDFRKIHDMPYKDDDQEREPDPETELITSPDHGKSLIISIENEDFDLYCPEEDDYYVGGSSDTEVQQQYLLDMIDSYARNSIANNSGSQYHRGGTGTIVINKVLLTTKWHQSSPFNDFCPIKRGERSPAGCVAIALGQIMAYHKYPQNLTCNGVYCDWNKMLNSENYSDAPTQTMLASFITTIGAKCKLWYGKKNTFGTAQNAKNCLKWFGYDNVYKDLGYDSATIVSMIDDDNPVFIAALSGITGGGHAWVIDGYKYQKNAVATTKAGVYYGRRTSGSSYQINRNTLLVHCNFGWYGLSNGYYASGIFNIKEGPESLAPGDLPNSSQINNNYNWWFRILTYNNPNN